MDSILKDMWRGNLNGQIQSFKLTPETAKLFEQRADTREKLASQLTEEQQQLLFEYDIAFELFMEACQCQSFQCGFRTATKLMTEVFYEDDRLPPLPRNRTSKPTKNKKS